MVAFANGFEAGARHVSDFTTFAGGAEANADRLATSTVKRIDLGVFLAIAAMSTASVEGGSFVLDATNGGVGYAPFHEAEVPADTAATLEQIRIGLAADEVTTSPAD